ncbi:DNA mismatch repair protein MutS [Alkalihalobacillus alcalophilus ATCC 27647 = CGMCC 1.3604]|uniref:Endonuclease MutS2 n=1 Tax=Alkalihalobacillus alcalophilus ATCC 27647 = CGMCC 1.3604 TaxID=1218173 RepID=A0A094WK51_ALKAL|nr:endonuclease MutS2 [Alkalihalobacillus alcalophilus]KGA98144.1 recombination and DNA strand exchange inhibitor protein [Alkalihalobacillus alcalophilus ATCC 27647 = CGMCC 1.3604]MED1563560.1 endonuclease MutS2 [Alkalihalobacillus alcalophilus]THG90792.1 DNA mismatch repair protein MutS [Alkalihalobacillus alcalophilus ATCC 27647 = CGMCC 1.3604]
MERVLRVLEYEKMKQQLVEHVSSSLGRKKVQELAPSVEIDEVLVWQQETSEGANVLRFKGRIPFGGIYDITPHVKRASIGGLLSASELMEIASTIYGGRQLKKFITNLVEEEERELPLLYQHVEQINPLTDVEREIKQCIDDNGHVLDSASQTLRTIRQQVRSYESSVRSKLEQMTRSSSTQKMLSDAIITIRNDRFVIPVKQEYRGSFGGIVHDQSASGQTLFIEPQVVVTLNNQLREAKVKETREIDRILAELSRQVAEVTDELLTNISTLAVLDLIIAKAHYANAIKATSPEINEAGHVLLKKARHPLIDAGEVVPIDIELGGEFRSLIITGPNTGGKTVTLKTVGLLTLMMQSGLHVPVEEESKMAVYKQVFADIGDEQSIEQSLSTFSSHMTNIVQILDKVDFQSLVLFDELGAGTDPTEGAALAIAILDDVYKRGAAVVATTHYSELKGYAYNREGVMNASVEFDVQSLKPTYRLLIGVPGRSNAFAISRRLGLGEAIIDRAKDQIDSDSNKVENMIVSLEESKKSADAEQIEAKNIRFEAEKLHRDLQKQMEELQREKELILKQAEEEAEVAVAKAKEEAEFIIRELREMQKKGLAVKEHEIIDAKKHLEEAAPKLTPKQKKIKKQAQQAKTLHPGDEVKVLSFGQKGSIIEKVNDKEYLVQIGIMKMKVALDDLQFIESSKPVETKPLTTVRGNESHVKPELDLRGERYENAMLKVEKYIDDALLAGYHSVSIIHGKGTGALRKGVKDLLKRHPHVKAARDAAMNEGGLGNTVVELK